MRGHAGIPRSSHQTLAALHGDVLIGLRVEVPLGQPKIDDVDDFALLTSADHEVVGLDIAMHEALAVDLLEPRDDLYADVQRSCQIESFLTE